MIHMGGLRSLLRAAIVRRPWSRGVGNPRSRGCAPGDRIVPGIPLKHAMSPNPLQAFDTPSARQPTFGPGGRRAAGVAWLSALVLWGCAVPAPPRPTGTAAVASRTQAPADGIPRPSPTTPSGTSAVPAEVVAPAGPTPATPATPADVASAPSVASSSPYSAAVAARFPDPPVRYDTPAFEAGRTTFTSNAEMQAALRRLVRDPAPPGSALVRLITAGRSQQGALIDALLFTREVDASPAGLARSGRPLVLLIGQQHGDEPAGSEALLAVARELAQGRLASLLDRIHVLVLPRANPDGAELGQRHAANGVDINRDHLTLQTPEALALATLARDYRPMVVVDAHEYTVVGRYLEKFGAVQRYDALLQYATTANMAPFITRAAEEWFRRPLVASLGQQGLTHEWYYTTSADPADKKVSMGGTKPDTGRNVNGLKNAVSLLVETRGVGLGRLHLQRRVHTQVTALSSVLASTAARAADLVRLRQFVDNEVSALACQGEAVVEAGPTQSEYLLTLLDPVTGSDKPVSVTWDSALQLTLLKARARPCGYWLAASEGEAVRRLRALGLQVQRFEARGVVRGETWRELSRSSVPRPDVRGASADAQAAVTVQVESVPTLLDVTPGSWYVPLDQPLAHLAVAALEPDTLHGYLSPPDHRQHRSHGAGARAPRDPHDPSAVKRRRVSLVAPFSGGGRRPGCHPVRRG